MATTNPKNFDERMTKRQEEEMVEDIWLAIDEHCHFNYDFKGKVNEFREMNFIEARNALKEELERTNAYVPDHLKFESKLRRSQFSNSSY